MVEDSKTWFEIYVVAIAVYEENDKYLNKIENNNNEDKIGAFQFQQLESFETKLTEKIFDLPILNVQGGTYPSSKINCVIGRGRKNISQIGRVADYGIAYICFDPSGSD